MPSLRVFRFGLLMALLAGAVMPAHAQRVAAVALVPHLPPVSDTAPALPGTNDTVLDARTTKSPLAAAALSMIFPGAGHVYAGKQRRGLLVAAVYWTGVAIIQNGRHDRVGKIGGTMFLGAWGFGMIDGARAASEWNRRDAITPVAPPSASLLPREPRPAVP